jgi:hypothetical protein
MKVYPVIMVARQNLGDFVFIRCEKVFKDEHKAQEYLISVKERFSKPVRLMTPQGEVECICEIGAFESDFEE